jgi:hypothetical protein
MRRPLLCLALAACSSGAGNGAATTATTTAGASVGGPLAISVVASETCHEQHDSGGTFDGLVQYSVNRADGTAIDFTFVTTADPDTRSGAGAIAGGKVTIKLPLYADGETLDLASIHVENPDGTSEDYGGASDAGNPPLPALPAFVAGDTAHSRCDLATN